MDPSMYAGQDLDRTKQQIRLLRLIPSTKERFECVTQVFDLEKCPEFVAASYVWGRDEPHSTILLNGVHHQVRRNLLSVLHTWRSKQKQMFFRELNAVTAGEVDQLERQDREERAHRKWRRSETASKPKSVSPRRVYREKVALHDSQSNFPRDLMSSRAEAVGKRRRERSSHGESRQEFFRRMGTPKESQAPAFQMKLSRKPPRIPWIWIDALCIDQNNVYERGHQVSFMASIYRSAKWVLAYIGPEKIPKTILESNNVYVNGGYDWGAPEFNDLLINLKKREYFKRAWIVQENALARKNSVIYTDGQNVISSLKLLKMDRYLKDSLIQNIIAFRGRKCADFRDHVYAFLGMSAGPCHVEPDYTVEPEELMTTVLKSNDWYIRWKQADQIVVGGYDARAACFRDWEEVSQLPLEIPDWQKFDWTHPTVGHFSQFCVFLALLLGARLDHPLVSKAIIEVFREGSRRMASRLREHFRKSISGNYYQLNPFVFEKLEYLTCQIEILDHGELDRAMWDTFLWYYEAYNEKYGWVARSKILNGL